MANRFEVAPASATSPTPCAFMNVCIKWKVSTAGCKHATGLSQSSKLQRRCTVLEQDHMASSQSLIVFCMLSSRLNGEQHN